MKNVSQQILNILEDENFRNSLESIAVSHGQNQHGDVTMKEAYERYMKSLICYLKKLIQGVLMKSH